MNKLIPFVLSCTLLPLTAQACPSHTPKAESSHQMLAGIDAKVQGHEHGGHDHHGHDDVQTNTAHVHGVAALNFAAEGHLIEVHFESPAANLVGFEHRPRNEEERQRVASVKAVFKAPLSLFEFQGAKCKLAHQSLDFSSLKAGESHGDSEHSDVAANYQFQCDDMQSLSDFRFAGFEYFPGLERLDVQWILLGQQGAKALGKSNNTIPLR